MPTVPAPLTDLPPELWARTPVPQRDRAGDTAGYAQVPVDLSDPRNAEPLVRVADYGLPSVAWYARTDGLNPPYGQSIAGALPEVWLRRGVVEALARVREGLGTLGYDVCVLDGYRPIATQAGLWAFFSDLIAARAPGLSAAAHEAEVRRFVSDPRRFDASDPTTWPVHASGGAVDLVLTRAGATLDHGTPFDDPSAASAADALERAHLRGEVAADDPALIHRRVLVQAMAAGGFTNYAAEWWHFDLGDQLHVATLREMAGHDAPVPRAAWYGYIVPPA
jgi:D-alanyl-D-alanine dipeptidase